MTSDRFWACPACGCVNTVLEEMPVDDLQTCENCEDMFLPSAYEATWEEFSVWCRSMKE